MWCAADSHNYMCDICDQCNSLLYGLSDSHIANLQRIQNSAARLVTCKRFHDHITLLKQTIEKSICKDCGGGKILIRLKIQS